MGGEAGTPRPGSYDELTDLVAELQHDLVVAEQERDQALAEAVAAQGQAAQLARALLPARRPSWTRPSAVADDHRLDSIDDLALALGGSPTSWTGDALRLIAKSDPAHLEMLRRGVPHLVVAWEVWRQWLPTPSAGVFLGRFAAWYVFTCPKCQRTSRHPDDVAVGYCGACHDYTAPRREAE